MGKWKDFDEIGKRFGRSTMSQGFVKPSINYGSVAGSAVKFYGQGILNLKKSSAKGTQPFTFKIMNSQAVMINAGMVNNVPVTSADTGWTTNGYIYIEAAATGGVISQAQCRIGSNPGFSQTPNEDSPPATLYIPIYKMEAAGTAKMLKRVLGNNNVTAIPSPVQWEYQEPGECGSIARVWYAWSVFS